MTKVSCFLSSADGRPRWALGNGAELIKSVDSKYDFSLGLVENISISFHDLVSSSGTKIDDISKFYFLLGPGSFTSLRTSFSFLKGLSASQKVPIVGMSSFLVYLLACCNEKQDQVTLFTNANREENFVANFNFDSNQILNADKPISIAKAELNDQILIPESIELNYLVLASERLEKLDDLSLNNLSKAGHLYSGQGSCELLYIKGVSAKTLKERGLT
jgi:tRNA threonylcarbamoyl adenosine modification protein YeaZ